MSSVSLSGRYLDGSGAERDCTLRGNSPETIEITGSHKPFPGERVICRIPGLGLIIGRALKPVGGAFRLELEAGHAQRERIAARLAWHAAQGDGTLDQREAVRVVPIRTKVIVAWEGAEVSGHLRDVSANSAFVNLSPCPEIGTTVTIGRRRARVVRRTESGIAVRFVLPLSPQDVTESIVL